MKRVMVAAAIVIGVCVMAYAAYLALIEVGHEVVVLHKATPEGRVRKTRLWIVDEGGYPRLHHADSGWIRRIATDPVVTVERGGTTRRYRATSDPESHRRVHALLREKYGIADRFVRFLAGDTDRCRAIPVRLEPL